MREAGTYLDTILSALSLNSIDVFDEPRDLSVRSGESVGLKAHETHSKQPWLQPWRFARRDRSQITELSDTPCKVIFDVTP